MKFAATIFFFNEKTKDVMRYDLNIYLNIQTVYLKLNPCMTIAWFIMCHLNDVKKKKEKRIKHFITFFFFSKKQNPDCFSFGYSDTIQAMGCF